MPPIFYHYHRSSSHLTSLPQRLLFTTAFKINVTTDVIGVELAGAFKNVLAIGAGFFDGLGLAVSSKAAFISEAAVEMRDLAIHLGASPATYGLGSHAWLGDLLTTCFGASRNRYFGELIGKGNSVADVLLLSLLLAPRFNSRPSSKGRVDS